MQVPLDHQIIASGNESTVYRARLKGKDVIIKKRKPTGRQQYAFEAYAYKLAHKAGARVPQVLQVDNDSLVLSLLPGETMDDQEALFTDPALFAEIASDLAKCHSIELEGFGDAIASSNFFRGSLRTWQAYLQQMSQPLANLIPEGSLTQSDLQQLQSFWSRLLPAMLLEKGVLLHGDFAMSAIFVQGKTYTGMVDFGDALIGDPLMDLAYFRFKEITKSYGNTTYGMLHDLYFKMRGLETTSDSEARVIFYMLYWGVKRLTLSPDNQFRSKFCDKLHLVAKLVTSMS